MSLFSDPNACAINAFYHAWDDYIYIFSPFNLIHRVLKKIKDDKTSRALGVVPVWKMQPWFTKLEKMIKKGPVYLKNSKIILQQPSDPNMIHPLYPKLQLMACVLSRKKLKVPGVSGSASKIIMKSWRSQTKKQYRCYWRRFSEFCSSRNVNPLYYADVTLALNFLSDMFKNGLGYSAINTARAAISTINGTGSHPLICRLLKGVFNQRPSRPRYSDIWDVSVVLNLLRSLSPARELSLLLLGAKLLTLCALVTGHRCQTFQAIDINHMVLHVYLQIRQFFISPIIKAQYT